MEVEFKNKKKITNPKRGYYSELLGKPKGEPKKEPPGAHKRTMLTWQVKTERYAPIIPKLIAPVRGRFLAPAERWLTIGADKQITFPVEAFKPKVQMEYHVEPGCLPRKVQIERKRREYGSHNIKTLLEEIEVDSRELIPPYILDHDVTIEEKYGLEPNARFLPLEIFDNQEFDCRNPDEWINLGLIEGVRHPVPAQAFLPKNDDIEYSIMNDELREPIEDLYDWINVAVTDYDPERELYTLLTLDGKETIYYLNRIFLMFKAEDPKNFAARVKDAVDRRQEVEDEIRYWLYIDCMLFPGVLNIPEDMIKAMSKMATRDRPQPLLKDSLEKLEEEVSISYKRVACNHTFRHMVEKYPGLYTFIRLPKRPQEIAREKGCVDTRMRDFSGTRKHLGWITIYVLTETYQAMSYVVEECRKAGALSLFTTTYGKFVGLEEFESVQNHTTLNVIKFLKGNWLVSITHNVRMCLRDVGKGWFNLTERKWEIYEISKLSRMMELIKYRMQSTLRQLVEYSLSMFLNLLETPCLCCLDCEDNFKWGDDLINSQFKPTVNPIFMIHLKMDENAAFYSTVPENFEKTLVRLFDNAVYLTHFIQQVHPFLLQHLKFAEDLLLSSVGLLEAGVCTLRKRLEIAYQRAIIPLIAYSKEYYRYIDLWKINVSEYVRDFEAAKHITEEIKEEISSQQRIKINLEATLPDKMIIGPFLVNVDPLKQLLVGKRRDLFTQLLDMFAARQRMQVDEVLEDYYSIFRKLNERPTSIEHIFELRDWMESVPITVRTLDEVTRKLVIEYDICDHFWYALSHEDFEAKWDAMEWPMKILNQIEVTEEFLVEETEKFAKIETDDEITLGSNIDRMTVQVTQLSRESDLSKCHEVAVDIRRLWKTMKEAQEFAQLLNQRQKLFGSPVVPFDNLNKLIKEFEPFRNLWITASDWLRMYEIWHHNPLINIDGESIDRTVNEMFRTMTKCVKLFQEIPAVQNVAVEIKNQIDDFRPIIPLFQGIRNPGMRERHWEQFVEETGIQLVMTPTLTFEQCLSWGIVDYTDVIANISESANKEYAIEMTLNKMQSEWDSVSMEVTPYKDSGTYIMKIADETSQMLDDHIVMTQQISFSPFKAAFEREINEWESKLCLGQEVLDEWMECQKQWMYLEPIFSSEDINRQLPVESKKYSSMERTWRRIMKSAFDMPKVMVICPDKRLLESLRDCNQLLEQVQKGLADYLETKRSVFPRFYFLSDEELLEILAQAKNPLAVQPHLRKCFENVAKLHFQNDLRIIAMLSAEGEYVILKPAMYPHGNVEDWLLVVEDTMRNTVRLTLGSSLDEIKELDRNEWVLRWPGQIVIAGSQTHWTTGVENGILTNQLPKFVEVMLQQLDGLRSLVKGPLKRVERQVLSALIVIEVHARDVTQKLLDEDVKNANDFEWISQLRYYWIEEQLKVRAVNAEFSYGYEYLGNSGRLVITPLTDRCYLTLTGALHLKFGGAPAGPAGTGKTESTKDLAKAFAIQCVVFNCSDQLDFMAMGKFFKGLASSGAWACFDEFNRIDIEVLSVVAQQITTIQKAQQARLDRFLFEGVEIALKVSCAVFITMNPGYAGRTELPDNLKALFRPVAMMVPNYTLIAEISLFSFGFSDAKELAGKITTTFKLSSEQLSTQDHYDFGMRAVKTVIAVAGNLKREQPEMDERQIVLRSLRDVNVPKFLRDDLKLFNGIVSDLFPRMIEQKVDYGILETAICESCIKMQLEDVSDYVKKVIQLYETTIVRHGLMLVGPTGSGKTKCYEVLKAAMTSLSGQPSPSGAPFEQVFTYVLNPKSITMGQLYGEFDLLTHEWTDGILSSLVRLGASTTETDKRWYVFDGPVDAVWIENMNTVLDDNKKLCLSSGEIIKLMDWQTMMFEVADLAVASPATVSRCGMVFLEPSVLGLQPFINCWMKTLPRQMDEYKERLSELFDLYLLPSLEMLRSELREIVGSVDSALVKSFLHLLDFRVRPLTSPDNKPPPPQQYQKLIPGLLVPWTLFALTWSIGATCDLKSRSIFSNWVRNRMKELKESLMFPNEGLVYDYRLHDGGFTDPTADGEPNPPKWVHWMDGIENYNITVETKYSDIEVPTIDNIRSAELLGILLLLEHQVLCLGPTGTGKTVTIQSKLSRGMHRKFLCDFITFSARTSANQTQDLLDSKLDRRRRGVFGPPLLKRQIFFIDDLNMPALEVYGAQPPIELIRQFMDFKGWYDRKNIGEFRTIIDVIFVGAMGPPGGGRNPITLRLLRHFHYLAFTELQDSSKIQIFGTILSSWLNRAPDFVYLHETLVKVTLTVYTTILQELLPTPAKTHYTFNLRDLSKVFQGVLMLNPESLKEDSEVLRLWYHECCRVFQDRLVNDDDRNWFDKLLRSKLVTDFSADPAQVLGHSTILFGDFLNPGQDVKEYENITDMERLSKVLDDYLDEYNSASTAPMKLVLFLDAIRHVCRISRIIRQPLGNALLLGMGGSGRQSLTRLASHMAEFVCFQVELSKSYGPTEWRDDIKGLMLKAGVLNRETVFLFSDTQIKSESFLEDLNNILNSGDVPNIYQLEEFDQIFQATRGIVGELGLAPTKSNLFAAYLKLVRSNLHSVITMSPIGEVFRARLRQFPALVNCCTIDWFSAWPESALQSVAFQFLDDISDLDVSEEVLQGIVVTCQYMHQSVVDASELFLQELSRHNYVTPTSYLELLASYSHLLTKKKGDLRQNSKRLTTGLDKLMSTTLEVKKLQLDLEAMKPALIVAADEAAEMLKQIEGDRMIAEETKKMVEKEELEAKKLAMNTQAIADDAQRDLDEAMPMLQAAENSLKALNKNDITEVRALKRPPMGVHLVMEAMCIVKDIKPIKVAGNMPGEKVLDYWEPGRAMLTNPDHFLSSLVNFDKDSITEAKQASLQPYIDNPAFQPAKIITVSKACTSLCMWVHAIYKYYFVNKTVEPKKAALAGAKADLAVTEALLAEAKERMKKVMDGLAILEEKLRATEQHKADLEAGMKLCEERMLRAVRLVGGLADEKQRWLNTVASIGVSMVNVTGDILISSGAIAYLTPFTDKYRRGLLTDWLDLVEEKGVPHTSKCSPVSVMGEPVLIRMWQLDGLPRDFLSTENAVLAMNSKRWPLFIDPQGQANRWVRNMGKGQGLAIAKLSDKDLIRTLESAIRFGKPCLIESVGIELDPALDPVLLRQVFKQGTTYMLKLGDSLIPYNDDFRLYLTTKLPNPHYTPEVSIKVLLVNFALVSSGLQDQLLALVVMEERPDLEEARSLLIISSAQMKHDLKDIEDRILHRLSASEGSPVDDIDLIITLEASKIKSEEIKIKVEAAERTQIDIDTTRALYIPVANRAQILFFCLVDLANVDPMYQYSLEWFVKIFVSSMIATEKSDEIDARVLNINTYFTFSLYINVCRSLFEKHKLHFAFLLCARILLDEGKIDAHEWHHLLAGGTPSEEKPNPDPKWLSIKSWKEIQSLEVLPQFDDFLKAFPRQIMEYKRIFDSLEPHNEPLPSPWNEILDDFQVLLILKALRPDKVTNAMQDYLSTHLGPQFIEPQTTDLDAMFSESAPNVPLIFVLSTGTDPAADLYKFADKMKFTKRMLVISLGQGQGPRAEAMFMTAMDAGCWVFFQNCHLAPSWMPRLERLIENISLDTAHKDFRVWLTSTPSPSFPVSILQCGSKLTVEPPRGVKANMMRAFTNQVADLLDFIHSEHPKAVTFKWLLFSLSLFHGVILERRKFGPLGFNIPYEFTDGDLRICISQLHMFLLEYDTIPFKVLVYTAGHINYGGRVTDDWDRRCIMNLLHDYYHMNVVSKDHNFDEKATYHQLSSTSTIPDYLTYIRSFPLNDDPCLFGLHSNADISYAQSETYSCLATLLALQPRVVGGAAQSQEEVQSQAAKQILADTPQPFNLDEICVKYPVLYEESLNTVLVQEVIRFNRLLSTIHYSLQEMLRALKGIVVMSEALESMSFSLFTNTVPTMWANRAYPSLKPLGAWVKDLIERIKFLQGWIDNGIPAVFWISGFYFPQAFLTGTLQNYARKYILSIDSINFGFNVLPNHPKVRPADGCCIWGLFLEGSRWSYSLATLAESRPKELYTDMPVVWLVPETNHTMPEDGVYECPVYKTLTRAGTLSTTGHSTNYVLAIEVPSTQPQTHWIKRGVALICALDY